MDARRRGPIHARVIAVCLCCGLAAISCGNFGIVSCRPQTLSGKVPRSLGQASGYTPPRLVVIVTLMRCKIDALPLKR